MKKFQIILILIIMSCSLFFGACDFFTTSTPLTITGYVYCDSEPLKDVTIKSTTQNFCTTNENGYFSFEINKKEIKIYAEKSGYIFDQKSITVNEINSDIIFTAQPVEELNGVLSLAKINITPSSIVSVSDNFMYAQKGNNCLKIKNFYVEINNKKFNCLTKDFFAIKNKSNYIDFDEDISINTNSPFSIKFSLDAYFTSYHNEYVYVEEKTTVLKITQPQTNAMLNENNQIEYSFWGVNSSNNKFSYNVTFLFDYFPNT